MSFVLRDSLGRIWITVPTQNNPWPEAISSRPADGHVAVIDEKGPRIVADGFCFTNEIRLDPREEWRYVAETCARRVMRPRVGAGGSQHDREV